MTSHARQPRSHASSATTRRAFALPLAVFVALVGSLTVAVILQRHFALQLAYQRQIESYVDAHDSGGIMECTLNWLQTARGKLADAVETSGHAFTMELPGGGTIDVSFTDGQGAALRDVSAVSGRRREIAQDLRDYLEAQPDNLLVEGIFRSAGPPEISVNTAKPIVIQLMCLAVLGEVVKAERAAQLIISRRTVSGPYKPGELFAQLSELGLKQEEKLELVSMLTAEPKLFMCVATSRDSSGKPVARSGGLYLMQEGRSETFKQRGAFLTWERLPLDSEQDQSLP